MSYVKLSNNLIYGIHPSIKYPDCHIDHLVDLTEKDECENFPTDLQIHKFPIPDAKAPSQKYLIKIVDFILQLKGTIYIFCKGGHGRSGLIASAVYGKQNNLKSDIVLKYVLEQWTSQRDMSLISPRIKKLGSPQTTKQKDCVKKFLDT